MVEIRRPKRASAAVPVLVYLILSACATGIIMGIGGCNSYGGRGGFFECFYLYASPIPMAFGIVKLPVQIAGAILCALIPRRPRLWAAIFSAAFLVGLIVHVALKFGGYEESWAWFPFVTVDFAILACIAACVRDPDELPRG